MSRRAIPLVSALALLLPAPLGAAPVPAGPKADDAVSPTAARLVKQRKIQKELKMSAEQRIAVLDGLADVDEEYEKKLDALAKKPDAPEEESDKLEKEREKAVDKLLEGAAGKLTAAQRARLRQLDLWLRGPAAFADPQVAAKLQLTDAQKKKAAEAVERLKGELDRYLDDAGDDDPAKHKAELFDFRHARLKELEDALTAEQKTAWAALLGAAPTGFAVDDLWLKLAEDGDAALPGVGK
jgi:hypothetical protein